MPKKDQPSLRTIDQIDNVDKSQNIQRLQSCVASSPQLHTKIGVGEFLSWYQFTLFESQIQAALYVEQLLQNRDDSEKVIHVFKKSMISPDTMKLQLYFTGDGDIINGIIVASLKNNGDLYVLASIFD